MPGDWTLGLETVTCSRTNEKCITPFLGCHKCNVGKLTGKECYEELSNEPAFSEMVREWKAYRSTGMSPSDVAKIRG